MASYDGSITIKLGLNQKDYDSGLDKATKNTESFVDKVKATFVGATAFKIAQKGWDLISGSIEKATNRLDSMAKAQQVMSILSGSTEKATEIVNTLNQAVTDTAYGLDAAATSTQKLATSGLDIDTSARMVMDLMDAITFYGDGTNETMQNVVDAMAKMNASGKISAEQWQRLTDAGVPLLKMFSEATGKSMAEVMDAFSTGSISAQQFDDILMDVLENGTESFPAVSGKAKEMAGSFATSFSNMSARIAIGVGNVITAFNNFLTDSGLPNLQSMIANFGSLIKNGLNWVAGILPTVLNGAVEIFNSIRRNMPYTSDLISKIADGLRANAGPALEAVKGVAEWFVRQIPFIAQAIDKVVKAISKVVDALGDNTPQLQSLMSFLGQIAQVLVGILFGALKKVLDLVQWVGDNAPAIVKNLDDLLPLIIAIAGAIAGFKAYFGFLNGIFKAAQMINKVKDAFAAFSTVLAANPIGIVIAAIAALVAAFIYLWNTNETFRQFWIDTWNAIVGAAQAAWDWIKGVFDSIGQAFSDSVKTFSETWSKIWQGLKDAINGFLDWANQFTSVAGQAVSDVTNAFFQWAISLPGKLWNWLKGVITAIKKWLIDFTTPWQDTCQNISAKFMLWAISLPAKLLSWLVNTIKAIVQWASQFTQPFGEACNNILAKLMMWALSLPSNLLSWLWETIKAVISWGGDLAGEFEKAASDAKDKIIDGLSKIPSHMGSIGANIVQGIKDGISGAWSGITGWFSGLADDFASGFKKRLGIHSPSRVFRNITKWIPKGMVEGIKDTMPEAVRYMSTAGDQLTDAFNADGLSTRMKLEGQSRTGESWQAGNTYTVNQTINSAKALTPSEISDETRNAIRRLAWQ